MTPVAFDDALSGISIYETINLQSHHEDRHVLGKSMLDPTTNIPDTLKKLYSYLGQQAIAVTVMKQNQHELSNTEPRSFHLLNATKIITKPVNKISHIGSCAITAIITDSAIHIANLGNSVAFLVIKKANGNIGVQRLNSLHTAIDGPFKISHAFGSNDAVCHDPEIISIDIPTIGNETYLIVASDSLLEAARNDESYVRQNFVALLNQPQAAKAITTSAIAAGAKGNITTAVINLQIKTKARIISIFDGHGSHEVAEGLMLNFAPAFAIHFGYPFKLLHASKHKLTASHLQKMLSAYFKRRVTLPFMLNLAITAIIASALSFLFYRFIGKHLSAWQNINTLEAVVSAHFITSASAFEWYRNHKLAQHLIQHYPTKPLLTRTLSSSVFLANIIVNLHYGISHSVEINFLNSIFGIVGVLAATMLACSSYLYLQTVFTTDLSCRSKPQHSAPSTRLLSDDQRRSRNYQSIQTTAAPPATAHAYHTLQSLQPNHSLDAELTPTVRRLASINDAANLGLTSC